MSSLNRHFRKLTRFPIGPVESIIGTVAIGMEIAQQDTCAERIGMLASDELPLNKSMDIRVGRRSEAEVAQ